MKAKKDEIDLKIRDLISKKKAQPVIHIPEGIKSLIKENGYVESGWMKS